MFQTFPQADDQVEPQVTHSPFVVALGGFSRKRGALWCLPAIREGKRKSFCPTPGICSQTPESLQGGLPRVLICPGRGKEGPMGLLAAKERQAILDTGS